MTGSRSQRTSIRSPAEGARRLRLRPPRFVPFEYPGSDSAPVLPGSTRFRFWFSGGLTARRPPPDAPVLASLREPCARLGPQAPLLRPGLHPLPISATHTGSLNTGSLRGSPPAMMINRWDRDRSSPEQTRTLPTSDACAPGALALPLNCGHQGNGPGCITPREAAPAVGPIRHHVRFSPRADWRIPGGSMRPINEHCSILFRRLRPRYMKRRGESGAGGGGAPVHRPSA